MRGVWAKFTFLMIESGITENLLDVVTEYIIWNFIDWIKYAEISLLENFGYYNRKPNIRP
jgi:hypothetical protein